MSMLSRVPVAALVPLALSPLAAGIAQAQEQLEEIVVTARLRAESSIEAPAAIKAFTAAEIDSAGIQTPHDYIALTPNMTVVQTQNPGNSFITIRGVSQARNSDMPVAVVVDGVLMTNPAQFNQELYDIQQIEVLKGPQGALYGRNAIGGAVSIVTKAPTDDFEARLRLGADSGPGYMTQGTVSGPLGDAGKWKYRASLSLADTDGFRDNEYLGDKADPYQDTSGRVRFTWEPNDNVTGDFRYARSDIETTALHFVINDDWRTLGSFVGVPNPGQYHGLTVAPADVNNVNYTGVPIRVNNPGEGLKDIDEVSMKWDVATDAGTFTSITAYDDLHELLTGDAFDFRPIGQSFNQIFFPVFNGFPPMTPSPFFGDWNQAQYLEVSNYSQEFRFTSREDQRVRWIAGAYLLDTERFIGTGNLLDTGNGVARVYKVPRSTTGFPFDLSIPNPQVTYLSDSQDNFAWAAFGQLAFDLGDEWDMTISARYDEDTREQTTETPPGFIPRDAVTGLPILDIVTGQKREETWDAFQPKLTLRWQPNATNTLYGDLSRGFRSGGFNQSGVANAGVAGVFNTFDEQIADTIEVGWKGQFAGGRVNTSLAYYNTELSGAYYFIFLVASSTQNLGSLDEVEYDGLEFELNTQLTDALSLNLGIATMDSEITADAQIPQTVGKEVPLTSDYTFNLGINWAKPLKNGREFVVRTDLHSIGDTYWGPGDPAVTPLAWNTTIRDPVNVVDLRVGMQGDDWSATVWAKNLFDEEYNDEFSFPFVWKAMPQRFGIQYTKDF
ncbi:MAG TPA: TonB-dependent receptor [Gammaproteobacteria bacterium]